MKRILLGLLLLLSNAAHALYNVDNLWEPYDGLYGMRCRHYNFSPYLFWKNPAGDWVDANGVANGTVPQHTFRSVVGASSITITLPTSLIYERMHFFKYGGATGTWRVHSREGVSKPELIVTYANTTTQTFNPIADTILPGYNPATNACGQDTAIMGPVLQPNATMVVAWPRLPANIVSAQIKFYYETVPTSPADINIFAGRIPRATTPPPAHPGGIAAQYPGDVGIEAHPSVIVHESFDRNSIGSWWTRTGGEAVQNYPVLWTMDTNFGDRLIPPVWHDSIWATETREGSENGFWRSQISPDFPPYTYMPTYNLAVIKGQELPHVWARYYVRFSDGMRDASPCLSGLTGGKLPGIAGNTQLAGNGGSPGRGIGWSLRGSVSMSCDADNPAYMERFDLGHVIYQYFTDQKGDFGDLALGTQFNWDHTGLFKHDTWHCVEQEVWINTITTLPDGTRIANADGGFRSWIDGIQGASRDGMRLRGPGPYLYDSTVPKELAIEKFWGTIHWGGSQPAGPSAANGAWKVDTDELVVATEPIGCRVPLAGGGTNSAPTIVTPVPDVNITQGQPLNVNLATRYTDPNGDQIVLTVTGLPSWATFANNAITGTPTNAQLGVSTVTVKAADPLGLFVNDVFTITVSDVNDPPVVGDPVAATQIANITVAYTYTVPTSAFTDPDAGAVLTYSATGMPSWMTFNPGTRTFSGTPTVNDTALSTIVVKATDQGGLFATQTFTVRVPRCRH